MVMRLAPRRVPLLGARSSVVEVSERVESARRGGEFFFTLPAELLSLVTAFLLLRTTRGGSVWPKRYKAVRACADRRRQSVERSPSCCIDDDLSCDCSGDGMVHSMQKDLSIFTSAYNYRAFLAQRYKLALIDVDERASSPASGCRSATTYSMPRSAHCCRLSGLSPSSLTKKTSGFTESRSGP